MRRDTLSPAMIRAVRYYGLGQVFDYPKPLLRTMYAMNDRDLAWSQDLNGMSWRVAPALIAMVQELDRVALAKDEAASRIAKLDVFPVQAQAITCTCSPRWLAKGRGCRFDCPTRQALRGKTPAPPWTSPAMAVAVAVKGIGPEVDQPQALDQCGKGGPFACQFHATYGWAGAGCGAVTARGWKPRARCNGDGQIKCGFHATGGSKFCACSSQAVGDHSPCVGCASDADVLLASWALSTLRWFVDLDNPAAMLGATIGHWLPLHWAEEAKAIIPTQEQAAAAESQIKARILSFVLPGDLEYIEIKGVISLDQEPPPTVKTRDLIQPLLAPVIQNLDPKQDQGPSQWPTEEELAQEQGDTQCTKCGHMYWSGTGHPKIAKCGDCYKPRVKKG